MTLFFQTWGRGDKPGRASSSRCVCRDARGKACFGCVDRTCSKQGSPHIEKKCPGSQVFLGKKGGSWNQDCTNPRFKFLWLGRPPAETSYYWFPEHLLVPRQAPCAGAFLLIFTSMPWAHCYCCFWVVIFSILPKRKLSLRETTLRLCGHTGCQWQSQGLKLSP